jgi:LPS-assembly lipoprotein
MRAAGTIAILGLAFGLAGCGFHPLYATAHGSMKTDMGSIYVEPVPDRLGYELRNQLLDLLDARARAAGAAYRLHLTLSEKSDAIGVQSQIVGSGTQAITQTAITRYNDTLIVNYELVDTKTNDVVTRGTETGLSAYNVLSSPYATLASQQAAAKNAADDIADRIRIDLAVYFGQKAKK